jgi:hypothetical protein
LCEASFHSLLVEFHGLSVNYLQGSLWAVAETGSEAVTVHIAYELGLAIYDCDGTLGACRDTVTASITELFVYFDDFTHSHESLLVPQHRQYHAARFDGVESMRNISWHPNDISTRDANFRVVDGYVQTPVDDLDKGIEGCGMFRQGLSPIECKKSHVSAS